MCFAHNRCIFSPKINAKFAIFFCTLSEGMYVIQLNKSKFEFYSVVLLQLVKANPSFQISNIFTNRDYEVLVAASLYFTWVYNAVKYIRSRV